VSTRLYRWISLPHRRPLPSLGLLLLGGLLGLGGWQGVRYLRFRQARQAAQEAEARYDFAQARDRLGVCRELQPGDAGVRLEMARVARRAGLLDEAEDHLNEYRDLVGKATPEGTLERSMLLAQRGELSKVERHLVSCLEMDHPQTDLILESLALGFIRLYRLDLAMFYLDRLLKRQPDNVTARVQRGQMHESVGARTKAIADYRAAVEAHPDHARARRSLANALLVTNRPREAAEHFEHLRRGGRANAATLLGLALARLELDETDEAREVLDELLAKFPDNGDGLLERGKLALAKGEVAAAEDWLRRSVRVQPHDYHANYFLARCLRRAGKNEEARRYRRRAERINDDRKRLGEVYPRVLKSPRDPGPRLEAGEICLRNGQEAEGLRWLYGALLVDPKHRRTHRALADYYEKHGDTERAREHRRQAGP
jgi:predicted Zn-dependent protease